MLHIAEISGSFSWNSSIFTFNASATLSGGVWSDASSGAISLNVLIVLKFAFHSAFASPSTTSGSIAVIGPLSHW